MSAAMRVRELFDDDSMAVAAGEIVVRGLSIDSRSVHVGDAFVALRGTREHGIAFAAGAVARGAVVVLAEAPAPAAFPEAATDVPTLWIDDLRTRLGALAARFHGDPSQALCVSGVTGTNGKTSTVQLLAQALDHLGRRAATIGTLGAGLRDAFNAGERTTPDAISVQRLLAGFREAGASDVAMEVSSHALEQGRVNAVRFTLAVFTNLTRDHLDYHGTMQAYGAAKRRLFAFPGLLAAIANRDDAFGRELLASLPDGLRALGYALDDPHAEVRAFDIDMHAAGLRFLLRTPWGERRIESKLLGRFNVSNLLAVAACLEALGFAFMRIVDALAQLRPVAGRMNRVGGEGGAPLVVIDYAHTPDALEQALASLRAHCAGQLVCVFGCGGERDTGKRAQMGAIAERLADRIIVTDDNPRSEDGNAIVADIVAGLTRPIEARIERDRALAIAEAIGAACADDVVLIAGKGHEPYQEIDGVLHAFDDLVVARAALEVRAC